MSPFKKVSKSGARTRPGGSAGRRVGIVGGQAAVVSMRQGDVGQRQSVSQPCPYRPQELARKPILKRTGVVEDC